MELVDVLSFQLPGYLANLLSDGVQLGVGLVQNSFGILNALANIKIPEIKAGSRMGRHEGGYKRRRLCYTHQDQGRVLKPSTVVASFTNLRNKQIYHYLVF